MDSPEARLKLLMIAGLAGNTAAYEALLESAGRRLRAYFSRRLGGDCPDVEDLVQETLTALHQRRESYDRSLPFTSWLHAIARYKLIDLHRRNGIRKHITLEEAGTSADPDELEAGLAAVDVERLLQDLPERHQRAIRLTRIEGHTVQEAAAMAGQSPSSIKINVHRGIRRLMARVRGGHDHD